MAAVTVAPASAADPQHGRRVQLSEQFVRQCIAEHGADSSHDWWHIHRVRNSALALAAREGLTVRPRCLHSGLEGGLGSGMGRVTSPPWLPAFCC